MTEVINKDQIAVQDYHQILKFFKNWRRREWSYTTKRDGKLQKYSKQERINYNY